MASSIQIFVGGSGRSGTSFLSRRLNQTKEVARLPFETRFITDNMGLIDIYHSLTESFSIDKARSSIKDFKELMIELDRPFSSPYVGYRLSRLSGDRNKYLELVESFLDDISYGKFYAWDKQNIDKHSELMALSRVILRSIAFVVGSGNSYFNYKKIRSREDLYLPKYFKDKYELAKIISRFVDSLFYLYASNQGKIGWCENTPSSILHYSDLKDFFPNAYFVNVVRNPVAVACSLMDRDWAPNDRSSIVNYLLPLYQRLIEVDRNASINSKKYKLIKYENLESSYGIEALYDLIGLQPSKDMIEKFEPIGAYAWKKRHRYSTIKYLEEKLYEPLKYFDY